MIKNGETIHNEHAPLNVVLTRKEREAINKKISGKKLTQQDSNRLSKSIRPKLREMASINAKILLDKLEYNQKASSIEHKIKKIILNEIKHVSAIVLYGSAIQTNYKNYNDVDVLVIVGRKFWQILGEKYRKIIEIKKIFKKDFINLDLEIYDKKTFYESYPSNVSLIYQLQDRKMLYGTLDLPSKLEIPKLDLRMKLDYSVLEDKEDYTGLEIYKAIRNIMLINLILSKIIDNRELINSVNKEIGENLLNKLKNNKESSIEKKIALLHLQRLIKSTFEKLNNQKWEKITLLSH